MSISDPFWTYIHGELQPHPITPPHPDERVDFAGTVHDWRADKRGELIERCLSSHSWWQEIQRTREYVDTFLSLPERV